MKIKTTREFIKEIKVYPSNLEHISKTGIINGSLLLSIDEAMSRYTQQFKTPTNLVTTEITAMRERISELEGCLKDIRDCKETWMDLFQSDRDRIESLINKGKENGKK